MNKSSLNEIALEIEEKLKDKLSEYREGQVPDYETARKLCDSLADLLRILDPSKSYKVYDNLDYQITLVELNKISSVVIVRVAYRKPVCVPPAGTPVIFEPPSCIGISAGRMHPGEFLEVATLAGEKRLSDKWRAPTLDTQSSKFTRSAGVALMENMILGKSVF